MGLICNTAIQNHKISGTVMVFFFNEYNTNAMGFCYNRMKIYDPAVSHLDKYCKNCFWKSVDNLFSFLPNLIKSTIYQEASLLQDVKLF